MINQSENILTTGNYFIIQPGLTAGRGIIRHKSRRPLAACPFAG
ncbi:hypothetical protein BN136_1919 [Cronobacter universalis NCTC 9529]|nr:hypothetical protein BN136_1919 [Cronobacter universalis NCTC 9529]